MHQVLERLAEIRLLPVVTLDDADRAEPLARVLSTGGLPCVEVTFRTPAAEPSLRRIAAMGEDLLVGAGTVLDVEQVQRAVDAGARFLASPGLDDEVVQAALAHGVPILAGVATATEVQRARKLGLDVIKLFPAETLGGLAMLKDLAAPFPDLRFVPAGGVDGGNLRAWLARPEVLFCGGSWLAPRAALQQEDFSAVRARVAQAVSLLGR